MKKALSALFFVLLTVLPLLAQNKVTFQGEKTNLRAAFQSIEKQSGKSVAFNGGVIDVSAEITTPKGTYSLEECLNEILSQVGAEYTITPKMIVVTKSAEKSSLNYRGRVFDDKGEPLVGATVLVTQSGEYVLSGADGSFEIKTASKGNSLKVNFLGFHEKTVTLGDKNEINIYLESEQQVLENAVVIGYGSVKRKDITTAVAVVATDDIETRPIISAASAIQGKAAGVQVIQPSGMPGSSLSIRVRGATSVQASNEPLYVVDGIPNDDISNLSSDDIASLQILKDASSSAIYGARAANGVILITTKRGDSGKTEVKFNTFVGISRLGKKIDALNTEEYKVLMNELASKTVTVPTIPDSENRYTDWTDKLFKTGVDQNYQVSLTSGTDKLRYYVSAGHTSEKGIVNKAYFRRTNFRADIDNDLYKWLSASLNFAYSHNTGRSVYESRSSMRAGSILAAITTPPFMQVWSPTDPTIYDEDAYGSRILNPLAANAADMTSKTDRVQGSISLDIKPFKGFDYKVSYSLDWSNGRSDYYLDPHSTSDGRSTKGRVTESTSNNREWLLENIVTYNRVFAEAHNVSVMAGSSLQKAQWNGNALAGYDLPEAYPDLHSVGVANQLDEDGTWSSASGWSLASFLGRINYNYDDRYLVSGNIRFDGSSKFAPGHRWGCFPSGSAAWRISNEDFMSSTKSWLNDLKLRVGYGLNGNQGGIGNYSYLASMSGRKVPPTEGNSYPGLAITPNTASNPELTWEKTTQINVGVDIALLDSRIIFSGDAYYKKTRDLLLTVTLPNNVNLPGGITRNDGQMRNKGLEFDLQSKNFVGRFKWTTDFNISFNRNKLQKLGLNKVYYYADTYSTGESAIILREGLPLGSFFGYKALGVNVDTGDIDYEDVSGNGSIGPEDRVVIGCAQPKFTYGLTNDLSWNGISLNIFFQGSYGNDIFNASRIETEGMIDFRNQSKAVLRRWLRPGMKTDIPRSGNSENIHNSSRFVEDGSYLRLKNVTLSYDFPKRVLQKVHVKGFRVFITGQNLWTLTDYSGYDPEVNAYGGDSVAMGVDFGTYPQSRTFVGGINLTF